MPDPSIVDSILPDITMHHSKRLESRQQVVIGNQLSVCNEDETLVAKKEPVGIYFSVFPFAIQVSYYVSIPYLVHRTKVIRTLNFP